MADFGKEKHHACYQQGASLISVRSGNVSDEGFFAGVVCVCCVDCNTTFLAK